MLLWGSYSLLSFLESKVPYQLLPPPQVSGMPKYSEPEVTLFHLRGEEDDEIVALWYSLHWSPMPLENVHKAMFQNTNKKKII